MAKLVADGQLDQGVVLDTIPWGLEEAPLGIVLTSTCDLEWAKADFITFAALKPAKAILQASREFRGKLQGAAGDELSRGAWDSLAQRLRGFIHNADIARYFFLEAGEALALPPLFADFQHLISVPTERARTFPVRATLPSPYREKLITHYSAYAARIGVDRLSDAETETLVALLAEPYHGPAAARA